MRLKILVSIFLAIFILLPANASALGGFTISPASQEVIMDAKAEGVSFELTLTNRDEKEIVLSLKAVDFKSLDESGGVAFVGLKGNEIETSYSLTSWMRFESDNIAVAPGTSEKVLVTIDNRFDLAPGGHYGAVIAVPVDPDNPATTPEVDILPATAALVLLKKTGGEQYGLALSSSQFERSGWGIPSGIGLRFQNTGNVHVVPRGTVVIRGPGGQEIAKSIINEQSGVVLPETYRKFSSTFTRLDKAFWPGRYQAEISWRYDGQEEFSSSSVSFWYIGWGVYVFGAILLLILVLCISIIKRSKKRRKTIV